MQKITKEYEVYTFDELERSIQDKVIEKNYDYNINDDWWWAIYNQAEEIGISITEFDIDRNDISGKFIKDADYCANLIINTHDNGFLLEAAQDYLTSVKKEEFPYTVEAEFKYTILAEFLSNLGSEYYYLTSRAAIADVLNANDCLFLIDGTPFYN